MPDSNTGQHSAGRHPATGYGISRALPGLSVALLLSALVPAIPAGAAFDRDQARCRDQIAKGAIKVAEAGLSAVAACHRSLDVGRTPAGTDCNVLTEADERGRVERARDSLFDRVGGTRGRCVADTITPARISHPDCPSPCDATTPQIETMQDVAECIHCLVAGEMETSPEEVFGLPMAPAAEQEARCRSVLTRAIESHQRKVLSRRRKCLKRAEKNGSSELEACLSGEVPGLAASAAKSRSKIQTACAVADLSRAGGCSAVDAASLAQCSIAETEASATRILRQVYRTGEPDRAALLWKHSVEPLLAEQCAPCHSTPRFGFATLEGSGPPFPESDSARNREEFLNQISLDSPASSRLLAKALGAGQPGGQTHGGGEILAADSPEANAILEWILEEKASNCPTCGLDAPVQYLAYVEQPRIFWALESDPIRADHGLRTRSKILLQPLSPHTLRPRGTPVDFLPESFCGDDGRCDFGQLAASHDGTMLAFECRMSIPGEDHVADVRWNICIAGIRADGRAENPRLLRPGSRISGETFARSTPFGLYDNNGTPLRGIWDHHFQVRRRSDRTPVFGPNDEWVYLSSRSPDPRTGEDGTRTYHGFEHLNHIIAVRTDGSETRTVYRNEGGQADFPFFRRNGLLAFHTWNLERMDRHLYAQSTPDGMTELPVLLGRVQGENRWGKAVELAGGQILGMTGRRRGAAANYVPFLGDHTLGAGLAANPRAIRILDTEAHEQIAPWPNSFCRTPPDGPNCVIDRWYGEPSWSPDGTAFIAHNPEPTHVLQGEQMYLNYSSGSSEAGRLDSMLPYTPASLGIYRIDNRGELTRVLSPPDGKMLRYPTWVGPRHPPRSLNAGANEALDSATLHIADVPVWLSFRKGPDHTGGTSKTNLLSTLDTISALRVLVKVAGDNACLNDNRPYRFAVNAGFHDHPTHLGINNATGYQQLRVPVALGGNGWGDIPLQADRSVHVRLPAGELLLFQGVDQDGHVVWQHSRVFALAPGTHKDTSVRRIQYDAQCAACHGTIEGTSSFVPLTSFENTPAGGMDFLTQAATQNPVDTTDPSVERRTLTWLHRLRPLMDRECVSCHSGPTPAGELSLEADYHPSGNYPAGRWATAFLADTNYLDFIPAGSRVPAYNYSVAWSWLMQQDDSEYTQSPEYGSLASGYSPIADLAPWDPGYQNLFANDGSVLVYLSGFRHSTFGRSDRFGGNSRDSWLLEILSNRDLSAERDFTGPDHSGYFSEEEWRDLAAVIDVGFPYMARCNDKTVPSGPNAGSPWGDSSVTETP